MAKREYEQFRALLRTAIGNMTQAEFASKSNISAEYLNRMLNSKEIHRPMPITLRNIAGNAQNGVTLHDLISALDNAEPDYHEPTVNDIVAEEAKRDFAPTLEDIGNKAFSALKKAISSMFTGNAVYKIDDLNDFMIDVMKRYKQAGTKIDIFYDIDIPRRYYGSVYRGATHYASVYLSIADKRHSYYSCCSQIILYFSYLEKSDMLSKSDSAIIQYASMDIANIIDLYGISGYLVKKYTNDDDGDDKEQKACDRIDALPYLLEIRSSRKSAVSSEKRLLDAIFGNENEITEYYEDVIFGLGFDITDVPAKFAEFIRNHRISVLDNYRNNKDIYSKLKTTLDTLSSENADNEAYVEALSRYFDNTAALSGWRAVIAFVMSHETGFEFELHEKTTNEDILKSVSNLSDGSVIVLSEDYAFSKSISDNTVISVVGRYAAELGLESFGDIEYHDYNVRFYKKKKRMFKVENNEQECDQAEINWVKAVDKCPSEAGWYDVILKDGRDMMLFYLPKDVHNNHVNLWLAAHKDWNSMMDVYDAAGPIKSN